jgi:hypothetical protein
LPDSSRFGGFVVQARVIARATRVPNGVPGRPYQHSPYCVRHELVRRAITDKISKLLTPQKLTLLDQSTGPRAEPTHGQGW